MRNALVEIYTQDRVFRFGTVRFVREEEGVRSHFIPYVIEFGYPEATLSGESDPPIPTISVTVWDGYSELRQALEQGPFESFKVISYTIDEDGKEIRKDQGYLSDPTFEDFQVEFTIRLEEDAGGEELLDIFKFDTFQRTEVLQVTDVDVSPKWVYHESTPWIAELFITPTLWTPSPIQAGHTSRLNMAAHFNDVWAQQYRTSQSGVRYYFKPNMGYTDLQAWNAAASGGYSLDAGSKQIVFQDVIDHTTLIDLGVTPYIQLVGSALNDGIYRVQQVYPNYIQLDTGSTNRDLVDSEQGANLRMYPGGPAPRIPITGNWEKICIGSLSDGREEIVEIDTSSPIWNTGGATPSVSFPVRASGDFAVKYAHGARAPVLADGMHEMIWVVSGGFRPLNSDMNSNMSRGFVHVDGHLEQNPVTGGEFRVANRARILQLPHMFSLGDLIQLELHNKQLIHQYGVRGIYSSGYSVQPPDEPFPNVQFVEFNWMLSKLETRILDNIQRRQDGERRGRRVDMFASYSDYLNVHQTDTSIAGQQQEYTTQNANAVDNVKAFGIATGSKHLYKPAPTPGNPNAVALTEAIYFATPEWAVGSLDAGYIVDETVESEAYDFEDTPEQYDIPYTNAFVYVAGAQKLADENSSLDKDVAIRWFRSQTYRVLHDEVPQGQNDLGKTFPIVYGNVERVPLIHATGTKIVKEDSLTAGDDIYIYASHPCTVRSPKDITIELVPDGESGNEDFVRSASLPPSKSRHDVDSPFPKVAYGHVTVNASGAYTTGNILQSPYHHVVTKTSNEGKDYYGIQLRGGEWQPKAGALDKRFPIRFGVGSTKLVATFRGYPLDHPLDIIAHFVKTYGIYPFSQELLDEANIERVKSLTRNLRAAVYINEFTDVATIVYSICRQFGISVHRGDKIKFSVPDLINHADCQWAKPISDGLNLIHGVSASDSGTQKVNNQVVVHYRKDWVANKYEGAVILDAENNRWCAEASKAIGSKRKFEIQADWINTGATAREVANIWASRVARRKMVYQVQLTYTDGIRYEPGEIVPMTCAVFGLDRAPVLITSVKEERDTIEMTVERYAPAYGADDEGLIEMNWPN